MSKAGPSVGLLWAFLAIGLMVGGAAAYEVGLQQGLHTSVATSTSIIGVTDTITSVRTFTFVEVKNSSTATKVSTTTVTILLTSTSTIATPNSTTHSTSTSTTLTVTSGSTSTASGSAQVTAFQVNVSHDWSTCSIVLHNSGNLDTDLVGIQFHYVSTAGKSVSVTSTPSGPLHIAAGASVTYACNAQTFGGVPPPSANYSAQFSGWIFTSNDMATSFTGFFE
ncbi:MAG: hypothetical protein OK422_00415 [Thaumarchaeota archaeon]|nr:hypothetical protein [Nitrososphaerota archaeon]